MEFITFATYLAYLLIASYVVLGILCISQAGDPKNSFYAIFSIIIWPIFMSQDEKTNKTIVAIGFILMLVMPVFTPIFFIE